MGGTLDASWEPAAKLMLGQDFTYRKPVDEDTEVRVAQDGTSLDIVFVVTQREARTEAQQTNGSSVTSDDYVGVYLFPQGHARAFSTGSSPTRAARAISSPARTARTRRSGPRSAIRRRAATSSRCASRSTSSAAAVRRRGARSSYAPSSRPAAWPCGRTPAAARARPIRPLPGRCSTSERRRPRSGRSRARRSTRLGELTTPRNGGSTSRIGGDFAIPVTPTASFVGTLHPDFSNVEIDQQTIAPSAFAYQFSEVRPFFTQAGQAFNYNVSCSNCPQLLYTPAIPTFREGYALEGTQGPVTFGAFNAIGNGRVDQGASVRLQHVQHAQFRRRELPARRRRHARRNPRRAQLVPRRRRQPENALLPVRATRRSSAAAS